MDASFTQYLTEVFSEKKYKKFCYIFSEHVNSKNFNESPMEYFSTTRFINFFERSIIFGFPKKDEEIPQNIKLAYENIHNFPNYPFASSKGIFIPAFQKSGGTYFTTTLSEILPKPKFLQDVIYGYDYDFSQFSSLRQGYIVHNHVLASVKIIAFCKVYKIRPIFLYRDIFECLVSKYVFDASAYENKLLSRDFSQNLTNNVDITVFENAFHYLKLFHSWNFWSQFVRVGFLDFHRIINDIEGSIKNTLRFLEIQNLDEGEITKYFEVAKIYNNRQERQFSLKRRKHTHYVHISDEIKNKVRGLYKHFKHTDFSLIDKEIRNLNTKK